MTEHDGATLHTFSSRAAAEKYLMECYGDAATEADGRAIYSYLYAVGHVSLADASTICVELPDDTDDLYAVCEAATLETTTSYTYDRVYAALNRAANNIIEQGELPDMGARDAVNLLVNAALHDLNHPGSTLDEVVTACYDGETLTDVLSWMHEGRP